MRVVEGDAGPEIAMRFIERLAQDPRPALDIGAEIVAQRPIGGVRRRAPMPGDFSNPLSFTCIGPMSTVPLVFWLTSPILPASTLSSSTSTPAGT